MSIDVGERNIAVSGESLSDAQAEACAQAMARGIFANAMEYLRGDRQAFTGWLETTEPVHARAAALVASLLEQTDFGDEPRKLIEVSEVHDRDTASNRDYHMTQLSETVAHSGSRAIKSVTAFSHTDSVLVSEHIRVVYSSYEDGSN